MNVAKILVGATSGIAMERQRIPARAAGLTVSVVFTDPIWDNLVKTVLFRGTGSRIAEFDGNTAIIPWEVMPNPGTRVYFGIYGTDSSTGLELPLIEVDIGVTERSTDPRADPGTDPTLPIWAQLQEDVEELKQTGGGGGYYTPSVTQPSEEILQFGFTPSNPAMPEVAPVQVKLPTGQGGNVDQSGLSATASALLITILRNGVYTSDQSANIDALAAELSVTEPEEPDIPDIPESDVTQTGSILSIVSGVTATQSGNVLAIA